MTISSMAYTSTRERPSSILHQRKYGLRVLLFSGIAAGLFTILPFARIDPLNQYALLQGSVSKLDGWLVSLHASCYTKSTKSQGSQDHYLQTIFSKIGTTNKYFVEFGFNEASYTSGGSGANTHDLHDRGWRGLLLDAENENLEINLRRHYLFSDNIVEIFEKYNVPRELDYLSCDMDSHDLFVLEAILKGGYRPRVITTEFNSNYPLNMSITQIDPVLEKSSVDGYKFGFKGCIWGASAGALRLVTERYGYTLVGRVGLLDLFWIRNDLLQQSWFLPDFSWFFDEQLGRLHHARQTSQEVFKYLMDYQEYLKNDDLDDARGSARLRLEASGLPCFTQITRAPGQI